MVSFQYYPGTFLAFPGTHRVTVDICHYPQYMCNDMSLDFLLGGFGTRLIRATDILRKGGNEADLCTPYMELGSNFNFLVFTELVPTDARVAMLLGLLSLCV